MSIKINFKDIIKSSLFLNLFSVSAASVISKLIGLIAIGYPARILGPENFGIIGFTLSLTAYAGILLIPGITTWGARHIAQDNNRAGEALVIVNSTRFFLAFITYMALFAYAFIVIKSPVERMVISIYSLSLFTSSLSVDWVFNGLELMRIPALIGIITSIINVIALFLLIQTPDDLLIYATFNPFLGLLAAVLGFLFLYKKLKFVKPSLLLFFESIKSARFLGISMSLVVILHYANNLIVKYYLGANALGIFMSAFFLFELATNIPLILNSVFLSRITRQISISKEIAIREASSFAQIHMILAFIIGAIFFSEAQEIIRII